MILVVIMLLDIGDEFNLKIFCSSGVGFPLYPENSFIMTQ